MTNLLETLSQQFDSEKISQLSSQLGADPNSVQKAIGAALPAMIGALSHASNDSQNLESLTQVVEQQDTGVMGSISNLLQGVLGSSTQGTEVWDSLSKVLGGRNEQVQRAVSKTSGIDNDTVGKLLKVVGPIVVAAIAKQMSGKQVTSASLDDHLKREQSAINDAHPGVLGQLFDQDNDGDFDLSDVASVVMSQIQSK